MMDAGKYVMDEDVWLPPWELPWDPEVLAAIIDRELDILAARGVINLAEIRRRYEEARL
jgi:hypothetical protein